MENPLLPALARAVRILLTKGSYPSRTTRHLQGNINLEQKYTIILVYKKYFIDLRVIKRIAQNL